MKEDIREKSKTSLEKPGNIETEANELLRLEFKTMFQTVFKTVFKTAFKTVFKK